MKCANCGAELKVGCVYCSVCGKEAQIVSDYSLLEEDFLRELLKEKNQKKENGTSKTKKKKSSKVQKESGEVSKRSRKKKKLIWAVSSLILLVLLILVIFFGVRHRQDNSYEYQLEKAEDYQGRKEYQKAEECLKRAIKLNDSSTEARMKLAEIYLLREELEKAAEQLQEVIQMDQKNQEAYQQLIQIYSKQKDYKAIGTLREGVLDSEIQSLFKEYIPEEPEFEPQGGVYQEETEVKISGNPGTTVYYSTDGSDPKKGEVYRRPISVKPGEDLRIRAISCNEFGMYSQEVEEHFQIDLQKPDMPHVIPAGGSFYSAQTITVNVPEGSSVYYTWDGTEPSKESAKYTGPINMPEGNNILSLILIDEHGLVSDVLKCNYIYIP
ncbi:MAG: tetratricopeptide repeat protein [Lachnospiraceae bacterium]|nr:tetratricopeptide repeat protein [Lachnospiraceae bacterium]